MVLSVTFIATGALAQQNTFEKSLPRVEKGQMVHPLPTPEKKTPMQVLERGGIPHQGNSTSGSPGVSIDDNTTVSPTFSPPGVKIERKTP
jgi:hypothetical protein